MKYNKQNRHLQIFWKLSFPSDQFIYAKNIKKKETNI